MRRFVNNLEIVLKTANGGYQNKTVIIENYFGGYGVKEIRLADGTVLNNPAILEQTQTWGSNSNDTITGYDGGSNRIVSFGGNDTVYGGNQSDTINGGDGDDYLSGNAGNDLLNGDAGNDTLVGGDGNDMLNGGDGSDWFYGGNGADRFVFDSVTGVEWIRPSSTSSASEDSVEFSAANAIAAKDIELRRFVNNLEIVLKTANGGYQNKTVVIENYFGGYGVKEIRLADGTVLNNPAILEQTQTWGSNGNDTITGYDGGSNRIVSFGGNDTVYGGNQSDTINGGDGDDYLSGNAGNDLLNGDAGNDTLVGGDGNDMLNGGDGSDWFYGGNGADRFVFDSVTGVEWIKPSSTSSASEDSVEFSAANAIAAKDIELRRFFNNLEIVLKTANGGYQNKTVVIENYFGGYGVKEIRLADGTVLNNPAILEQTQTWGSNSNDTITGYDGGSNRIVSFGGNDTVYGGNLADTINGGDGDDYLSGNAGNDLLNGDAGNDTLVGDYGNDVLQGNAGADWLDGGDGNDVLDGGDGNDVLKGGAGSDVLVGGRGNDTLGVWGDGLEWNGYSIINGVRVGNTYNGGQGNDTFYASRYADTYLFAVGDGQDIIHEEGDSNSIDVVLFSNTASIALNSLERWGDNLLLGYGAGDVLTVADYFSASYSGYKIEQFTFSDDVNWDEAAIKARVITNGDVNTNTITGYNDGNNRIYGLDGNDTLYGGALDDVLDGGDGNDVLKGGAGSDVLVGGRGNDTLNAEDGNDQVFGGSGCDVINGGNGDDLLDGGTGNDRLTGGAGNDTYLFGRGSGADILSDYDLTPGNTDVLTIDSGVATDQLWFHKAGSDLAVSIIGTTDKNTISNWYSGNANHIEQFKTADGKILLDSQVDALVSAMAAFAPPAAGQTTLPPDYQAASGSGDRRQLEVSDCAQN